MLLRLWFQLKKIEQKNASTTRARKKKEEKSSRAAVCAQKTDRQTDRRVVVKSKDVIVFLALFRTPFYVVGTGT